eukprot:6212405-Pleurochrysis_carterae.AAC.1
MSLIQSLEARTAAADAQHTRSATTVAVHRTGVSHTLLAPPLLPTAWSPFAFCPRERCRDWQHARPCPRPTIPSVKATCNCSHYIDFVSQRTAQTAIFTEHIAPPIPIGSTLLFTARWHPLHT